MYLTRLYNTERFHKEIAAEIDFQLQDLSEKEQNPDSLSLSQSLVTEGTTSGWRAEGLEKTIRDLFSSKPTKLTKKKKSASSAQTAITLNHQQKSPSCMDKQAAKIAHPLLLVNPKTKTCLLIKDGIQ